MNSHAALDSLACGYARAARREKLFVMVNAGHVAYIDESHGSHKRRILILSACVASYEDWQTFSDEWRAVLDQPPKIDYFHMREARTQTGQFQGWKRLAIDHKIIALCEVICKNKIHTVNCWVDELDYKETVGATIAPDFQNPYHICFHTMVIFIARVQERLGFFTPVDYVFDEKGDTGQEALFWYSAIKECSPPDIRRFMGSTPVFRSDDDVLPLQAADIVAWRRRRMLESSNARDPELAATMRLDTLTRANVPIDRKYLEIMARDTSMVPGIADARSRPSIYKELKSRYRKEQRIRMSAPKDQNADYESFNNAMDAILKADPDAVKAAIEAEKREREEETQRTGKRGRGRPPKPRRSSASSRASSGKD